MEELWQLRLLLLAQVSRAAVTGPLNSDEAVKASMLTDERYEDMMN